MKIFLIFLNFFFKFCFYFLQFRSFVSFEFLDTFCFNKNVFFLFFFDDFETFKILTFILKSNNGKTSRCGAAFKSKTKRSLDQHVKSAGSNLSPAQYQLAAASDDQLAVTSCFRSKTDRQLHDISWNKVPGPGTYDPKVSIF